MVGKEKNRAANAGPKFWQFVSAGLVFFLLVPFNAKIPSNLDHFDLSLILEKTGEYCSRLASASLDFVCQEEIRERLYYSPYAETMYLSGRLYKENQYLYDYQLIRKSGQMLEKRILLEENGKKRMEPDAGLKTKMFEHKYVIFGPVGLLSPENQLHLSYQVEKAAKLAGENIIIIDAKPKGPEGGSRLYGKVWIRERDFSILKIEWDQSSMGNIEGIMEVAEKLKAKPYYTFVSEYQLTLTRGKIEEQRILLVKNGLAINQAIENLGTRTYKNRIAILEPMGILDLDGQRSFNFRIIKQADWNGVKVAILRGVPRDDEKKDYFSVEAWIALNNLSLIRLELSQRFPGDFDGIEKTSEGLKVEPRIKISLEFLFMKDGIRFPTSCRIEESYVEPKRTKFLRSMTTVTYENHRVQVD